VKHRVVTILAALLVLAGCTSSTVAAAPTATPVVGSPASTVAPAVTITGVDLHDGMILQSAGTYYLYGTEYGCGFQWRVGGTPWCGYGVSTASSLAGPWSTPQLLFSPSAVDPYTGMTWAAEAGASGHGMFVPRMVQRSGWGANDGTFILYFPDIYLNASAGTTSYIAMGCNGPTGPCGYSAPSGSVHKIAMHNCTGDGDASFVPDGQGHLDMICTTNSQTLAEDQLDEWGTTTTGAGSTNVAGLTAVESSGVYQDPTTSTWIMTYSDPNCGYCSGDPTGYATASNPLGPWTTPANTGWGAPSGGRRDISATSCGGQPDTVSVLDGQPYELVDLWYGAANETNAGLHLEPLNYRNPSATQGGLWQPFAPWSCS
jgi:hypothetical protein